MTCGEVHSSRWLFDLLARLVLQSICPLCARRMETKLGVAHSLPPWASFALPSLGLRSAVTRGVTDIPFVLGNAFVAATAAPAGAERAGWMQKVPSLAPSARTSRMGIKGAHIWGVLKVKEGRGRWLIMQVKGTSQVISLSGILPTSYMLMLPNRGPRWIRTIS